jgi:hypothetical protein
MSMIKKTQSWNDYEHKKHLSMPSKLNFQSKTKNTRFCGANERMRDEKERKSFNLLINSTSMKFYFPRVSGMNVWKISKYYSLQHFFHGGLDESWVDVKWELGNKSDASTIILLGRKFLTSLRYCCYVCYTFRLCFSFCWILPYSWRLSRMI